MTTKIAALFLCLACACHARRVSPMGGSVNSKRSSDESSTDSSKSLASLLLALNPADAFSAPIGAARAPAGVARPTSHRPMVMGRQAVPKMQVASKYEYIQMANECLAEGCPVDKLEEFIDLMKKEDLGMVGAMTIAELEAELANPRANKNKVEEKVTDLRSILRKAFVPGLEPGWGKAPPGPPLKPTVKAKFASDIAKIPDAKTTAAQCLESGCSLDMLDGLVFHLNKDPSADPAMVAELERLLVEKEKNQNAIEKLVRKVGDSFFPMQGLKSLSVVSQKAADCIEAGCPVDLVDDLLATMENQPDQAPEVLQAIKELKAYRPKADQGISLVSPIWYLMKLTTEVFGRELNNGPTKPLKPWGDSAWKYDRKTTYASDWARYG